MRPISIAIDNIPAHILYAVRITPTKVFPRLGQTASESDLEKLAKKSPPYPFHNYKSVGDYAVLDYYALAFNGDEYRETKDIHPSVKLGIFTVEDVLGLRDFPSDDGVWYYLNKSLPISSVDPNSVRTIIVYPYIGPPELVGIRTGIENKFTKRFERPKKAAYVVLPSQPLKEFYGSCEIVIQETPRREPLLKFTREENGFRDTLLVQDVHAPIVDEIEQLKGEQARKKEYMKIALRENVAINPLDCIRVIRLNQGLSNLLDKTLLDYITKLPYGIMLIDRPHLIVVPNEFFHH